jgi:hypothetical protein
MSPSLPGLRLNVSLLQPIKALVLRPSAQTTEKNKQLPRDAEWKNVRKDLALYVTGVLCSTPVRLNDRDQKSHGQNKAHQDFQKVDSQQRRNHITISAI